MGVARACSDVCNAWGKLVAGTLARESAATGSAAAGQAARPP